MATGSVDLCFPMKVEIFLVYPMPSNCGLYLDYFEDYVIRLWVTFKYYRRMLRFLLKLEVNLVLFKATRYDLSFEGYGSSASSAFKALAKPLGWYCMSLQWLVWELGSNLPS